MLDGPYAPRVLPLEGSTGGPSPVTRPQAASSSTDEAPSVQRVGTTQWSRVAAAPPPAVQPAASALSLSSSTPCGIPWNRLYSSSVAPPPSTSELQQHDAKQRQRKHEEREENFDSAVLRHSNGGRVYPSAAAAPLMTSSPPSILYRPPRVGGTATYAPPPPPSGAAATLSANSAAAGHHYHSDEAPPDAALSARNTPASFLSPDLATASRYREMAFEHRYGSATSVPAATSALQQLQHSSLRNEPRGFVEPAKVGHSLVDAHRRRDAEAAATSTTHDGFRDANSGRSGSGPIHSRHRHRSPFSNASVTSEDGKEGAEEEEVRVVASKADISASRNTRTASDKRTATAASSKHARRTPSSASSAVSSTAEARAKSASKANSRSHSRHPQPRDRRSQAAPMLRDRASGTRAASGQRTQRSASRATTPTPRTAQWAVKLIDDLVAQVAVQQTSAVTGPLVLSTGTAAGATRDKASVGAGAAATTVADLTTSFLTARYGALQWRPILQDFAVCLHRYHAFSPTIAVFREYFIHVDVDTLSDFHLFCRLYAAADIPHCSTVEVRRIAVNADGSRGPSAHRGGGSGPSTGHTIVSRRYIEVREVLDRLQKMLQTLVVTQLAPCLVVGDDIPLNRSTRREKESGRKSSSRQHHSGHVQYRYARGPPARTSRIPQRRRLTSDEIRAVKRVVVTWVEESVEAAEHDRLGGGSTTSQEHTENGTRTNDESDDGNGDEERMAVPTLRHVAFDRPGLVDAYAFLQATLEAVKLLCTESHSSKTARNSDSESSTSTSTNSRSNSEDEDAGVDEIGSADVHSKKLSAGAVGDVTARNRGAEDPPWQATTPTHRHLHSPLMRRVLESPPEAYAYPVNGLPASSARAPRTPRGQSSRSSPRHSFPPSSSHRRYSEADYVDCESTPREVNDEDHVEEEAMLSPRRVPQERRSSPHRAARVSSYQQPRAASAATAAARAAHRSPDGRLWSPPRDGVMRAPNGKEALGQSRRQSPLVTSGRARPSSRPSARAGGSTPRRASPPQQLSRKPHERRGRPQHPEYAPSAYEADVDGRYFEEAPAGEDDYYGSSNDRFTHQLSTSPRSVHHQHSAPSSPQRYPEAEPQTSPRRSAHVSIPYVVDLHAERRWQEMQRQVAAAERRDAQWRHHPRIQARLLEQQQQQQQGRYSDVYPQHVPDSAEATLRDIDLELQRRERSRDALQPTRGSTAAQGAPAAGTVSRRPPAASPSGYGPPPHLRDSRAVPDVLYVRDPQEAAALAHPQVRLLPPPAMGPVAFQPTRSAEAYPSRVLPAKVATQQLEDPLEYHDEAAVSQPLRSASRIRVERVTPPTAAASFNATRQSPREESQDVLSNVKTTATTAAPGISSQGTSVLPSAGVRFAKDTALSKDTVCLTDEEQAMLDQLEMALHRLDTQHRKDHAAAASIHRSSE